MNTHNHKHLKYYSQNETANKKLIKSLIHQTSITGGDLVYDIGAGRGNITEALLERGARVVSIEKDGNLYRKLQQRFLNQEAVSLHHADFLLWEFSPGHRYKVFANIPFIQTSEIIRKLLFGNAPPEDCYLIMQKEAALKYAGIPRETLASLLIKPRFWADIVYHFSGSDFSPAPGVDIVLMQFEKRKCQLIPEIYYAMYRDFIVFCREGAEHSIKKALKNFFPYDQIMQLAELSGFDLHERPADLNFMQYLCIFQFLLGDNLKNIAFIQGAESRLERQRAKLKVIHRTNKKY
jgi:23S rRNA (adenine-N6)-dimethyltransferase